MTLKMFNKAARLMIKRSGGSVGKINMEKFIERINDSFIFNTFHPNNYPLNYWLGTIVQKNPLDLMILQEIIFERKPDTIIECGTCYGGSAYYMAGLMDLMNIDGKIITIDHNKYPPVEACPKKDFIVIDNKVLAVDVDFYQAQTYPKHSKIEYIYSDCLTAEIPKSGARTMVILDCDHTASHVYAELEKYSNLVTIGQYIIVEDTLIPNKTNGPAGAVKKFLKKNKNFFVDKGREKYGVSSNPGGYLLKVS